MIYLYDSSFFGFLTALFYGYTEKNLTDIQPVDHAKRNFFDLYREIPTEEDKAYRILSSLKQNFPARTSRNLYRIYLSEQPQSEMLALHYLKLCYQYGAKIDLAANHPVIHQVESIYHKISLELERMKGFVRFQKIADQSYYSEIAPDHNMLLIMHNHFTRRFADQNFIIHDTKRHYALIYRAESKQYWYRDITASEQALLRRLAKGDHTIDLFQIFFRSITITERENLSQQRHYMPMRYRIYMEETH